MKVTLKDMTIEGTPEEVCKFISLKDNKNVNRKENKTEEDRIVIGTCKSFSN